MVPLPIIFATDGPTISVASIRRRGGGGIGNEPASWTSTWQTPCPMDSRWLDWQKAVALDNEAEIKALEADRGSCLAASEASANSKQEQTEGFSTNA